MLSYIDSILNKTTMYRLVLYCLSGFLVIAMALGFFGILPYKPLDIAFSTAFIIVICLATNYFFSKMFDAPTNVESIYITALILALIITPIQSIHDMFFFSLATWASIWAMASKYIFAIKKKHFFNPVAFALVLTAVTLNQSASWWIGTASMAFFVFVGGILIVRKTRRSDLIYSFFLVSFVSIIGYGVSVGHNWFLTLQNLLLDTPVFFFAFVMLTEPLTMPPSRFPRIIYGAIVGLLFAPFIHIGNFYFTPEIALIIGNIFSYLVSPKYKLILKPKSITKIANDTYDFAFEADEKIKFKPGQYMEWTIPHKDSDSRGNRRYFTIASSPTENEIHAGIKFYPNGSTLKKKLLNLNTKDIIVASQLSGDFVMPKDKTKKLVFIAGGIGITPFRSMIKYLSDRNEKRDIILLYSNKTVADIAYKSIFDEASRKFGLKTIYAVTDEQSVALWVGKSGFIDVPLIVKEVPDYLERTFYLSGPPSMVNAFDKTLRNMGIKNKNIKKDFFPGFA